MNEILKQRLVGATILLALGVLFWPIIFVEQGEQDDVTRQEIPARPQVTADPVAAPDPAGLRTSPPVAARSVLEPDVELPPAAAPTAQPEPAPPAEKKSPPQPIVAKPRDTAPPALRTDSDGIPVAWILQVASVSSAQKADSLRQRLLDMGQKGYVKKIKRGDKDLYRVYIGPKYERDRLERVKPEIDAEFGVNSMISRYLP
ncbi:MAG: hypothetical protein HKN19_08205 [Halioglobus sp.]|nr:hypothetical protein [Halioglobus sp.]